MSKSKSKSKTVSKCPLCGHEIEHKKSAKSIKSTDLVVYDSSIYWRVEDEFGDLGACLGDGLSSALSESKKKLITSAEYYALELYVAILSSKIRAKRDSLGKWSFGSNGAASKGKTELVRAVNFFLAKEDLYAAFDEAIAAAKKALEPRDEDEDE